MGCCMGLSLRYVVTVEVHELAVRLYLIFTNIELVTLGQCSCGCSILGDGVAYCTHLGTGHLFRIVFFLWFAVSDRSTDTIWLNSWFS